MDVPTQLFLVFTLMLTSKGVRVSHRLHWSFYWRQRRNSIFQPGILIILGIDELMDMARTATNVMGNCLAKTVDSTMGKVSLSN
jgi:proton glutamate symport protein